MFLSYGSLFQTQLCKNKISNTRLSDVLSGLIRDQTVCIGYQQTTKVAANRESLYLNKLSFCVVIRDLRIGQVLFCTQQADVINHSRFFGQRNSS